MLFRNSCGLFRTCQTTATDLHSAPTHHRWPLSSLSGKQDSNLQPPASKAGKQPIVIFPVLAHPRNKFSGDSRESVTFMSRFLSKNSCDPGRIRTFNLLLRRQMLCPVELRNQYFEHKKSTSLKVLKSLTVVNCQQCGCTCTILKNR